MDVRRTLALALVVPLLLAGCTEDEPEPKMPDPPSTSSEPSPSPTETETAEAESAEDFIRRWVAIGDEMQVTGDTAGYDAMTPRCRPCQSFVKNVEEVYEAGGSAEFAGSEIVDINLVGRKPSTLDVTKDLPDTVIHEGNGEQRTLPGGRTTIRVTLGKSGGEWVVTHFVIV